MSKIAIIVTKAVDPARAIAGLRRALPDSSIADLRQRIEGAVPVVESILFENDYPEVAARLRSVVDELTNAAAEFRVFELEPAETFDLNADLSRWEISTETLLNILASAASFEQVS